MKARTRDVTLLVPYGRRALRLELPADVAAWLRDQLDDALGGKPSPAHRIRRPVRLRRDRWLEREAVR